MAKTPSLCVQVKETIHSWKYRKPVVFTEELQRHIRDCADYDRRKEALNRAIETWQSFAAEQTVGGDDARFDYAEILLSRLVLAHELLRDHAPSDLVRGELLLIHDVLLRIRVQGEASVLEALPRTLLLVAARGTENQDEEEALFRHWREVAAQP